MKQKISDLCPLEPDAEEFEVHDTEVGDGEGEQVDGRADGTHLPVRQDHEVEAVGHRAGNDDRQEAQTDRVQDRTQPRVHGRVVQLLQTHVRRVRLIGSLDHPLRCCRRNSEHTGRCSRTRQERSARSLFPSSGPFRSLLTDSRHARSMPIHRRLTSSLLVGEYHKRVNFCKVSVATKDAFTCISIDF